ncbi:olfactory receptor 1f45-like [Strix uralensis]|uniref:olfactory receptor 1f45-like n=1 Tax=Strix uralensis TaxID=36305 RepID=UPI003DA371F6
MKDKLQRVNLSTVSEFVLVGLSDAPEVRFLLFVLFLITYLATVAGNITILVAISTDTRLHNPMYFFLGNLSLLDILCPTITVLKMLEALLLENQVISFTGCMFQLFFFIDVVGTEIFLLAVMAYDRYVAICHPLQYMNIVSMKLCAHLAIGTWVVGFFNSLLHTSLIFTLFFCDSNEVDQYYCDIPPMLAISCSPTYSRELVILTVAGVLGSSAFVVTLISYIYILLAILCMNSSENRYKAFSTCGSHLTVVCIFYGTTICTYVRPSSTYSPNQDRIVSMLYGILTPLLNPIIYSLRNKEVKSALRRVISQVRTALTRQEHRAQSLASSGAPVPPSSAATQSRGSGALGIKGNHRLAEMGKDQPGPSPSAQAGLPVARRLLTAGPAADPQSCAASFPSIALGKESGKRVKGLTIFFIYVHPSSHFSVDKGKAAVVIYILVILMMNPLIYSLI